MFYTRLVYGILTFAFLMLFVVYGGFLFHFLLVLLLLLPLFSLLFLLPVKKRISIRVAFSETAVSGGNIRFAVLAENRSVFPCPYLEATLKKANLLAASRYKIPVDDTEKIRLLMNPKGSAEIYRVYPVAACGKYELEIENPCIHDILGLFTLHVPFADGKKVLTKHVYVYPKNENLSLLIRPDDIPEAESDRMHRQLSGSDRSEIFQNREYREGDPVRDIHWKLSAKLDTLILKEYSRPLVPSVHLLLEFQEGTNISEADKLLSCFTAFSFQLLSFSKIFRVSYMERRDRMETVTVSTEEDLHILLTHLLSMPATAPWEPLEYLLQTASAANRCRFVYLCTGLRKGGSIPLSSFEIVSDRMRFTNMTALLSEYSKETAARISFPSYDLMRKDLEKEVILV